jgi:uncharacterized protein VirK/YbjX
LLKGTLIHLLLPAVDAFRHVFAGDAAYGLKKCLQALPVLLNLRGQVGYVRLIHEPHTLPLSTQYPRLAYKWLGHSFSLGFSARTRLRVSVSHYSYLREALPVHFLGRLFERPVTLWGAELAVHRFSVLLTFPRPDDQEGDLALTLKIDGLPLCTTSFVFCDGKLVGADAAHVMLVARMQGGVGRFERVRQATQICHDVAPADLLMAALAGVATAFGVEMLVGVSTHDQVSLSLEQGAPPFFDYDGFWSSYGSSVSACGLHHIVLPYPEKPLESIRSKHRGRTRRKREFRARVAEGVAQTCRRWVRLPPADSSPH